MFYSATTAIGHQKVGLEWKNFSYEAKKRLIIAKFFGIYFLDYQKRPFNVV